MNKINRSKGLIVNNTAGANLVEYIMLVGLVALVAIAGFRTFGQTVTGKVNHQAGTLDSSVPQ